jgi:hypothetical protein
MPSPTVRVTGGMELDWRRLSTAEQTVVATGALLLVSSFIPGWATFSGLDLSFNLWGAFGIPQRLGVAAGLFAAILGLSRASSKDIVPTPSAYLKLSGAAVLLLMLGVLMGPGTGFGRGVVLYMGTLIAGVQTYAGLVYLQENRRLPRAVRRATVGRRAA